MASSRFDEYKDRIKPAGVLYVDVYPFVVDDTVMLVPSAACELASREILLDASLHTEAKWLV